MNVTATLFGQMITFVIFVWFIKAYLWEPLTKAMDDRSNKIADGLAAAEKGQQKIEQAEIQFTTRIDEAKTKASGIITDAEQQFKNIVDDARTAALAIAAVPVSRIAAPARRAVRARLSDKWNRSAQISHLTLYPTPIKERPQHAC